VKDFVKKTSQKKHSIIIPAAAPVHELVQPEIARNIARFLHMVQVRSQKYITFKDAF
jgi:hypothetical protein